jgi:hypothetical protein
MLSSTSYSAEHDRKKVHFAKVRCRNHVIASRAAVCDASASSWRSCRPGRMLMLLYVSAALRRSGCTKHLASSSLPPTLQLTDRPDRLLTDRSAYILYLVICLSTNLLLLDLAYQLFVASFLRFALVILLQ